MWRQNAFYFGQYWSRQGTCARDNFTVVHEKTGGRSLLRLVVKMSGSQNDVLQSENEFACVNKPVGCKDISESNEDKQQHEKECVYNEISCCYPERCKWKGLKINVAEHFQNDHPESNKIDKPSFHMTWQDIKVDIIDDTEDEDDEGPEFYDMEVLSNVNRNCISFRRCDNTSGPIDMKVLKFVDPETVTIKVFLPRVNTCEFCKLPLVYYGLKCAKDHVYCLKYMPRKIPVCFLCEKKFAVVSNDDDLSSAHAPLPTYICHNNCSYMTCSMELIRQHEHVCFGDKEAEIYKPIISVPFSKLGDTPEFYCGVRNETVYSVGLSKTISNNFLYSLNVCVAAITDSRSEILTNYVVTIDDGDLMCTNSHPVHRDTN